MVNVRSLVVLVAAVLGTWAAPAKDVQIVESTIREVRATAPDDLQLAETSYDHNYGVDDVDSVGYLKRSEDGGSDGYKHFDSYHKKDGDQYGFEKHTSFGDANSAEHDSGEKAEGDDKGSYKVSEELNEGDDNSKNESYEEEAEPEKYIEASEAENSGEHYDFDDEMISAKYYEEANDDPSVE